MVIDLVLAWMDGLYPSLIIEASKASWSIEVLVAVLREVL